MKSLIKVLSTKLYKKKIIKNDTESQILKLQYHKEIK